MTFPRHDASIATGARRVAIGKIDDTGTQQLADVDGLEGDSPKGVVRVQPHGFSSNPPAGSEGLVVALGGRSERLHMIGGEHEDHKPKDLPAGAAALYSDKSAILKMIGDDITVDAKGTATWTVKVLTIKCGGVTVTIDGDGLAVTSGAIRHDGHDIGKTHKHTDVQTGSGLTGTPQ